MLLLAQTGSVKIGEVVRYTVTYTPSRDRILPSPEKLCVRIRNTSNIALRAAFVHGPYTLCVAAYPASYNPNEKFNNPRRYGVPSFEPMLKAGGVWECELVVPEDIRQSAATSISRGSFGGAWEQPTTSSSGGGGGGGGDVESASWVVEISSQVIFSTSAAVGYEILVARDEKSLNLSSATPVVGGQAKVPQPGKLSDHQQGGGGGGGGGAAATKHGRQPSQTQGVFSRAVHIKVEDTAMLWNSPRLPEWDNNNNNNNISRDNRAPHEQRAVGQINDNNNNYNNVTSSTDNPGNEGQAAARGTTTGEKQKKIHLVILTHGLHSNLGADMLYMKESIDAAARQAKIDAQNRKARKKAEREQRQGNVANGPSIGEGDPTQHAAAAAADDVVVVDDDDESDGEEVIVRGYSGNATKTEKGIKYLGKRLARYVLSMTYPDQPFLPLGKGAIEGFQQGLGLYGHDFVQIHKNSIIPENTIRFGGNSSSQRRPFKITSISFIGHSLGGLVQTYAIAYIQKHSPTFFNVIKPINFIALASPFLGLSNENPLYVKFALDFGLVGRTGQDLGLTWRAPTIARSGWGAIVSNLGESAHKKVYGESQPESKPLLRILPTGPAHTALKKFRNRTVYSSVVNDGIVPLRTSCLLFLDWQGLGRVGKARRDAGLVETVVGFGWAELTGANSVSSRQKLQIPPDDGLVDSGCNTPVMDNGHQVPQPSSDAMAEDDRASLTSFPAAFADDRLPGNVDSLIHTPLSGFFNLFKSSDPPKEPTTSEKQKKIVQRSQILRSDETSTSNLVGTASSEEGGATTATTTATTATTSTTTTMMTTSVGVGTGKATSGHELENDPHGVVMVPPRTTFFESAGDLLNPKIPDVEYLLDPSKRPRTIFHDRVYHPSDIPPPPIKKRSSGLSKMKFKTTTAASSSSSQVSSPIQTGSGASSPYPSIHHEGSGLSTKDYDDTVHTGPGKQANEVVDGSNMRVEEKIARGYHRDLSWRKVLVKLEPDAHNNIVVRRMFTNAYGWPVMKHLVDAHFSDSAVARVRDADERLGERALDINQPPNEHGDETKTVSSGQLRGLGSSSSEPTDAMEAREALDEVPDLPRMTDNEAGMLHSGERRDSMSWSERDWIDSENESDADFMNDLAREEEDRDKAKQQKQKQQQQQVNKAKDGSQSPSGGWNWAEKIVGKGSTRNRSQSPATSKK